MNLRPFAPLVALSLAFGVAATDSSAAVFFYQGFDYGSTPDSFIEVASDDWTQSAGSTAASYLSESLTYPNLASTGGSVLTTTTWGSSSNTFMQTLNIDVTGKTEFWVSALYRVSATTTDLNAFANLELAVLQNDWQSAVTRAVGKNTNMNDSYSVRSAGTNTALDGGAFSDHLNDTVRVVYRLAEGSAAEFWFNPGSEVTIGTGQSIGSVINNLTTIETLKINYRGYAMRFDEFAIADSYSDFNVIPEPRHLALITGACGLLLIALRRVRRQG